MARWQGCAQGPSKTCQRRTIVKAERILRTRPITAGGARTVDRLQTPAEWRVPGLAEIAGLVSLPAPFPPLVWRRDRSGHMPVAVRAARRSESQPVRMNAGHQSSRHHQGSSPGARRSSGHGRWSKGPTGSPFGSPPFEDWSWLLPGEGAHLHGPRLLVGDRSPSVPQSPARVGISARTEMRESDDLVTVLEHERTGTRQVGFCEDSRPHLAPTVN